MRKRHQRRHPNHPPRVICSSWWGDVDADRGWPDQLAHELVTKEPDAFFGMPLTVHLAFRLYSPRGLVNHGPIPPFAQPSIDELVADALVAMESAGVRLDSIAKLTVTRHLTGHHPGVFVEIRPIHTQEEL